jgi:hypothetical protein
MICFFHHEPGSGNRMDDAFDRRHGTGTQGLPLHDRGIHPPNPVELPPSTLPRIEQPALFEHTNDLLYNCQRGCASIEQMISHFQASLETGRLRASHGTEAGTSMG